MPSPADREDPFEQLLQRSVQGQPAAAQACLDAETLASIVDGRLAGESVAAAEAHVADCARCQATLAALVRSEPAPQPRAAWWRLPAVRWLVPATATAAAVVLWVAVDRQAPAVQVRQVSSPEASVEVPAVTAPPAAAFRDAAPPPAAPRSSQNAGQGGTAPDMPDQLVRRTASKASAAPVEAPPQAGQSASPPEAMPLPPAAVAGAVAGLAPPPPTATAPAADSARAEAVTVSPPRPASPTPAAPSRLQTEARAVAQMVTITRDIPTSDPRYRWRLMGRAVQRSTDAGVTWQDQATGTIAPLNAGSAVSPEVCWLVGAQGLVLVTVDGLAWQRVTAPVDAPLVSVSATSADAATVTAGDGRTFATVDRGRTWTAR